jgi:cobalt/nickel transport system permease protein
MLALPFVLAALPLVLTIPGEKLFTLSVGPWVISITYPGLERFISIALKSWISMQAAIVLAACTSFPELLVAMRAIRVPRLLVSIFGLMWRYLFVLVDEAFRLMRARASRSGKSDHPNAKSGGSLSWRARVVGGMAGNLFLRGLERSDRIYMAMVSRGYDGEARSLPLPGIRPAQWVILISSLGLLTILMLFAYLFWG